MGPSCLHDSAPHAPVKPFDAIISRLSSIRTTEEFETKNSGSWQETLAWCRVNGAIFKIFWPDTYPLFGPRRVAERIIAPKYLFSLGGILKLTRGSWRNRLATDSENNDCRSLSLANFVPKEISRYVKC